VHGVIPDMLNNLQKASVDSATPILWRLTYLTNAKYNDAVNEVSNPGKSGSFPDGMCGGGNCDMIAADVTINWDRKQNYGAKYSEPYTEVGLRLFMRFTSAKWLESGALAFRPFDWNLWGTWIFMCFFMGLTFAFLENPDIRRKIYPTAIRSKTVFATSEENPGEGSQAITLGDAMYSAMLSNYFAQDSTVFMTGSARVLIVLYSLMVLILVSCYTASCTFFLVQNRISLNLPKVNSRLPDAYKNLADGVNAAPDGSLLLEKGSSVSSFADNSLSLDSTCRKESKDCKYIKDLAADYSSYTNEWDRTKAAITDKSNLAWIADDAAFQYLMSRLEYEARHSKQIGTGDGKSLVCTEKWQLIGDPFYVTTYGWVFGPSLPQDVRNYINAAFGEFTNDQSIKSLRGIWFNQTKPCIETRAAEESALSFNDFWVLFLLLLVISVAMMIHRMTQDFKLVCKSDKPPGESSNDFTTHGMVSDILQVVHSLEGQINDLQLKHQVLEHQLTNGTDVGGGAPRRSNTRVDSRSAIHLGQVNIPVTADIGNVGAVGKLTRMHSVIESDNHLPFGWRQEREHLTGRKYYANRFTKTTTWERPTE